MTVMSILDVCSDELLGMIAKHLEPTEIVRLAKSCKSAYIMLLVRQNYVLFA